jgi:hypothetical protein
MITTPRPTHQAVPGPTREVVRRQWRSAEAFTPRSSTAARSTTDSSPAVSGGCPQSRSGAIHRLITRWDRRKRHRIAGWLARRPARWNPWRHRRWTISPGQTGVQGLQLELLQRPRLSQTTGAVTLARGRGTAQEPRFTRPSTAPTGYAANQPRGVGCPPNSSNERTSPTLTRNR